MKLVACVKDWRKDLISSAKVRRDNGKERICIEGAENRENKEKQDQRKVILCRQVLANARTLFKSKYLPMFNTLCSISNATI